MSLPHRHRSPDQGQGVPAPSSDAIDVFVEAVSAGARPSSGASGGDGAGLKQSSLTLPRGARRRSRFSWRLTRWFVPALAAFSIGLGGAVWSLRTLDSFNPHAGAVEVSPLPHTPVVPMPPTVAPSSSAPVERLASSELRPTAPFAASLDRTPVGDLGVTMADTSKEAPSTVAMVPSTVAPDVLRPRAARNVNAPAPRTARDTPSPMPAEPAPIETVEAMLAPSAPEERPALAGEVRPVNADSIGMVASTSAAEEEESAVREIVEEYAVALEQLDVTAAAVLWPSVDRRALSRAFASLKSQDVMFDDCDVALEPTTATARCHGTAHYVVKVGPSGPRTGRYEWLFKMRKRDASWKIEALSAWPMASGSRDQQ